MEMKRLHRLFAGSAIAVTKRWRFHYPTRGEEANAPFVSVRVPVDYILDGQAEEEPGKWQAYVPGPRQHAPWLPPEQDTVSADALASWGVYPAGRGPRLLTPLEDS